MMNPPPVLVTCKECSYQRVFAPKGDAIIPWTYNKDFCTKCKSKNIDVSYNVPIFKLLLMKIRTVIEEA